MKLKLNEEKLICRDVRLVMKLLEFYMMKKE